MLDFGLNLAGLRLLREGYKQYKYWRGYRGERIRIEQISHVSSGNRAQVREIAYIIEGTVEDVMSFPPGFRLSDVEEYAFDEELQNRRRRRNKNRELVGSPYEYDSKFISFRDVQQIVTVGHEQTST